MGRMVRSMALESSSMRPSLLDDRKVQLRVAAMAQADKFQLHIYAALAEQEREFISIKTKAALKEASRFIRGQLAEKRRFYTVCLIHVFCTDCRVPQTATASVHRCD